MKKTVLVIEDDQSLADALCIILESEGYNAKCLGDGEMIVKKIQVINPQVVVVDYRLPGDDGLAVSSQIRSEKKYKELPIILMSASHSNFSSDLKNLNIQAFIQKPFEIDDFLRIVAANF